MAEQKYFHCSPPDWRVSHISTGEQRAIAVIAMRSQPDELLLQLDAKEPSIQRQHRDILRLHEEWAAADRRSSTRHA